MKEQLVSFKTAILAKKKGFTWKSQINYIDEGNGWEELLKPTQSLLQKWLRDEHKIFVSPEPYIEFNDNILTGFYIGDIYRIEGHILLELDDNFKTYEEALEKGLQEALLLI